MWGKGGPLGLHEDATTTGQWSPHNQGAKLKNRFRTEGLMRGSRGEETTRGPTGGKGYSRTGSTWSSTSIRQGGVWESLTRGGKKKTAERLL